MVGHAFLCSCRSDYPGIFPENPFVDSCSAIPFLPWHGYCHVFCYGNGVRDHRLGFDSLRRRDSFVCHIGRLWHKHFAQETLSIARDERQERQRATCFFPNEAAHTPYSTMLQPPYWSQHPRGYSIRPGGRALVPWPCRLPCLQSPLYMARYCR